MKNTERLYQQIANSEGCSLITIDGKPYGVLGATINYEPRGSIELEVMDAIVPQWNGEGEPPLGTICTYKGINEQLRVFAIDGDYAAVASEFSRFWCLCDDLKPIRTPEQIAADEREAAIKAFRDDLDVPTIIAIRAYENGYRKQST